MGNFLRQENLNTIVKYGMHLLLFSVGLGGCFLVLNIQEVFKKKFN